MAKSTLTTAKRVKGTSRQKAKSRSRNKTTSKKPDTTPKTAPAQAASPGLIDEAYGVANRIYQLANAYDRYRPGDEFRLDYRNDLLLSLLEHIIPVMRAYFRYEVIGLDNVPPKGRCAMVANHGVLPVDALLLFYAIKEHVGRWPRGLTDRRIFRIPVLRQFFMDLGIVQGDPETGRALLDREEITFIMPGGAKEAFKSSQARYKLLWKRRMGFVRLAIQSGAPIVPSVCIGIDDTYRVLLDGYHLSEKLFGKDSLLPISIPIGLGPLPLPVKLTHYIGKPIRFKYKPEDSADPAKVERVHRRVIKSMEALLEQGIADRNAETLIS